VGFFFMSRRLGKIVGAAVVVLCVVAFGVGIALLGKAYSMSAHVDEPRAQELTERYDWGHFQMSPQEREQREREIAGLRTPKWSLYNIGVCICLAAVIFAVAIVRLRLWNMLNLRAATTPRTRWRLIALGSALALIPAIFIEIHDEYAQDDLTPQNGPGTGGAMFLLVGIPTIIVVWLLATLICRFVVLRNVNLPAALWYVDHTKTYRNVGLKVFYGAMIGLIVSFFEWSAV
jgi:hypothetical protein